jgi:hypothetical protein
MDPMLIPGLIPKHEKIVNTALKYLNIECFDGSTGEMAAARRLCIVLLQDLIKPKMRVVDMGSAVDASSTIVKYTNNHYKNFYKGDVKIYTYIYHNVRNKINGEKYYEMKDLYLRAARKFPATEDILFYIAKPFILFFVKENMSKREIITLLDLPEHIDTHKVELENKDVYMSIIEETLDEMILEIQQTK